ncbi:MAG: hypothetical protein ABIB11_02720 [Candidatus Omnitrophota bacterium]
MRRGNLESVNELLDTYNCDEAEGRGSNLKGYTVSPPGTGCLTAAWITIIAVAALASVIDEGTNIFKKRER